MKKSACPFVNTCTYTTQVTNPDDATWQPLINLPFYVKEKARSRLLGNFWSEIIPKSPASSYAFPRLSGKRNGVDGKTCSRLSFSLLRRSFLCSLCASESSFREITPNSKLAAMNHRNTTIINSFDDNTTTFWAWEQKIKHYFFTAAPVSGLGLNWILSFFLLQAGKNRPFQIQIGLKDCLKKGERFPIWLTSILLIINTES